MHTSLHHSVLTNSKVGFIRKFSGLRHSILHYASVVTFITFFHTLNPYYISISSTKVNVIVYIILILLPLKCNAASCGFNLEGCFCSSGYWMAFRVLNNLRRSWKKIYFVMTLQNLNSILLYKASKLCLEMSQQNYLHKVDLQMMIQSLYGK